MSLAEAYWELSYLGLVHGQARTHILRNSYVHIQKVVKHRMADAEAFFLQARIALTLNNYDVAEKSLSQAVKFEVNTTKAKSYQKELIFITRYFEGNRKNTFYEEGTNKTNEQVSEMIESWG